MEPGNFLGLGQGVMDTYFYVSQDLFDEKSQTGGGQQVVDREEYEKLVASMEGDGEFVVSGSTTNMVKALSDLGESVDMRVVIGNDNEGKNYVRELSKRGISVYPYKVKDEKTACSAILVAPNGERDMNTYLGAAKFPFDIPEHLFDSNRHVHIEGYLMGIGKVVSQAVEQIRFHDLSCSIDLGSEGFVNCRKDKFQHLMNQKVVRVLFGNEDEIMALTGESLKLSCKSLTQYFDTVVATRGSKGGFVQTNCENKPLKFSAKLVEGKQVVNSTGCGDNFMAGYLYGYVRKMPPKACAEIGALLGAEVIQHKRPDLPRDKAETIRREVVKLFAL